MKNLNIENETGRSMIEMLGVLAIIGVLSVGGIAGYSKAMQKYRINKTIEQFSLISGNIQSFFASQNDFTGLDILSSDGQSSDTAKSILKKAKLIPDEMWNSAETSLENAFGGEFIIYGSKRSGSAGIYTYDKSVSLYVSGISEEACIELFSHDWTNINGIDAVVAGGHSSGAAQTFNRYSVNGSGIIDFRYYFIAYKDSIPVPVDKAVTACAASVSDDVRGFGLRFKK